MLPRIGTGAALLARGALRESPASGQKWEVAVSELEIFGEADPQTYPLQKKGHYLRVPARDRPPAAAHEHARRRGPRAQRALPSPSTSSSRAAASCRCTRPSSPPATAKGRGRCSASRPSISRRCPTARTAASTSTRTSSAGGPTSPSAASSRPSLRAGPRRRLHLRPHLPRRELQHRAPPRRVLDDRAGDGLLRSRRQHGLAEDFLKHLFRTVLEHCAEDMAFFDQIVQGRRSDRARSRGSSTRRSSACTYTEAVEHPGDA